MEVGDVPPDLSINSSCKEISGLQQRCSQLRGVRDGLPERGAGDAGLQRGNMRPSLPRWPCRLPRHLRRTEFEPRKLR
jgi:hypothetical protein